LKIGLAVIVIAALIWLVFFRHHASSHSADGSHAQAATGGSPGSGAGGSGGSGRRRGAGGADGPVPVSVAEVAQQDVPIYEDGLGTVQAFNTATVRAQVDGVINRIAFTEGQDVKAGDLLAQIDPRPYQASLDQAVAKQAQDQALLNTAKADLIRYEGLVSDGYVSRQQSDTQRQLVAQYEAAIRSDEGAVKAARVNLGYTTITSPIDGVTGIRQIDIGNLASAASSTGLVIVTQIKPISVLFTLPEQTLSEIRAADGQKLPVIALDRDNAKEIGRGELTVVDNQIDQTTGTIKLKATFPNSDKALWPGQFINARLLVRTEKNALVIPTAAVQRGPKGEFVYVVGDDMTAQQRDVVTIVAEGGNSRVTQGLKPGEKIVTDGQYRLQPGSKIKPSQPGGDSAASDKPADATTDPNNPDKSKDGKHHHRRQQDGSNPPAQSQ
jgi:multidrug efflux system membrane fusion protein